MHLPWREVPPREGGPPINTSLTAAEAAELGVLARGMRVLEIGSAHGYSAVVMALAGAKQVTTIDPHMWIPGSLDNLLANVGAYEVPHLVEVIKGDSWRELPRIHGDGQRFGLVFVDGDHAERAAAHDTRWALRLLSPGGMVAVHDYGETCCCPGVEAAMHALLPTVPVDVRQVDTMLVLEPTEVIW